MKNCIFAVCFFIASTSLAQEATRNPKDEKETTVTPIKTDDFKPVFTDDFEASISNWELMDDGWKHVHFGNSKVLSLFKKESDYKPAHRSPTHLAILKEKEVTSFQLDLRVHSSHKDYNHRDVCLFFGYQGPSQYYYVHLGKKTDPHCNQIFIVNNTDRTSITTTTNEGTNWDKRWHSVRLVRDVDSGQIQVFFDDMDKPAMTATDKTFLHGRIGLGSFDDTASFDNLQLLGIEHQPATKVSKEAKAEGK